jgi:enamine deaminase RidA (YjgF/YER057c/UK114 family)
MPNNLRFSNPDAIAKPPGYSHVVEAIGPGRLVYFAGQLGMDKSGKMGASARDQMELAFQNLKAALASVGAGFEHLVKINNYIVNIGANIAQFREVRDKYVNTAAPPASTTIGVPETGAAGRFVRDRGGRDTAAKMKTAADQITAARFTAESRSRSSASILSACSAMTNLNATRAILCCARSAGRGRRRCAARAC